MSDYFSHNLRSLCADYPSIAQVCRDIGINRQQFNRYLNGAGMPSAHNLRRIARHFNVSESTLLAAPADFAERKPRRPPHAKSPAHLISGLFEGQATALRRYLGCYHGHYATPTWENRIARTLIWLREQDGYVIAHTFERGTSRDKSIVQRTRYSGLVTYRNNRIYLMETANAEDGFVSETILFPAHRQQVRYLQGMTLGLASRPRRMPYASATIWKKLPGKMSARDALSETGVFGSQDTRLDMLVRKHLSEKQPINRDHL